MIGGRLNLRAQLVYKYEQLYNLDHDVEERWKVNQPEGQLSKQLSVQNPFSKTMQEKLEDQCHVPFNFNHYKTQGIR